VPFARLAAFALVIAVASDEPHANALHGKAVGAPFEVASIKPRQAGPEPPQTRMIVTPGRISFQAVLLRDCLRWAYGLADYQIAGVSAAISSSRWDIEAKTEGPATDVELRQMFRRLLDERFALRARQGTENMRILVRETVRTPGTPPPSGPPPDLFGTAGRDAIREQLGLTLTPMEAPIDVLVIESVQQPSEN
jgi:hypothetical protein